MKVFPRKLLKKIVRFLDIPEVEDRKRLWAFEVKMRARGKDGQVLKRFGKHYPGATTCLVGLDFIDAKKPQTVRFVYPWRLAGRSDIFTNG